MTETRYLNQIGNIVEGINRHCFLHSKKQSLLGKKQEFVLLSLVCVKVELENTAEIQILHHLKQARPTTFKPLIFITNIIHFTVLFGLTHEKDISC